MIGVVGYDFQPDLIAQNSRHRAEVTGQGSPPAPYGVTREFIHGLLEGTQRFFRAGAQRRRQRAFRLLFHFFQMAACGLQLIF